VLHNVYEIAKIFLQERHTPKGDEGYAVQACASLNIYYHIPTQHMR
jgi:hypothetical protein